MAKATRRPVRRLQLRIMLQQGALARWFGAIDAVDAIIVAVVHHWESSRAKRKRTWDPRHKKHVVWVCHRAFLEENPLVPLGEAQLGRRLGRLVRLGILIRLRYSRPGRGSLMYYAVSEAFLAELEAVETAIRGARAAAEERQKASRSYEARQKYAHSLRGASNVRSDPKCESESEEADSRAERAARERTRTTEGKNPKLSLVVPRQTWQGPRKQSEEKLAARRALLAEQARQLGLAQPEDTGA